MKTSSWMTRIVSSNELLRQRPTSWGLFVKSLTTNYLHINCKSNLNLMKREIFNAYVQAIAKRFDLTSEEIFTKKKQRHLVDARHVLYYMCSKRPMNLSYIQMYMGENGYDICHSAIIHGIKKVTAQIEKDSDYKGLVSDLNNQL